MTLTLFKKNSNDSESPDEKEALLRDTSLEQKCTVRSS